MKSKEHIFKSRGAFFQTFTLINDFYRLSNRTRSFVLLLFCSLFITACEETPCISDPETLIGIEFSDGSVAGTVSKKYPVNKIQIRNSQVYQETISQSTASIKIRFPSDSETFWLSFLDSTSKDSVRFSYSRTLNFAGESCGFYYGFRDIKVDSLAGVNFQRAQILTNQGDSSNKVHVQIFW
jgi:hypothetical protein